MEAEGIRHVSAVVLSSQSTSILQCRHCGSSTKSACLGSREAASINTACSTPVSRFQQYRACDFFGRVGVDSRQSPSRRVDYVFISISGVLAAPGTGTFVQSSRPRFHRSALGGNLPEKELGYSGNRSLSSLENCPRSFALAGHREARTGRAVRVSMSPAAETDSRCFQYGSEVSGASEVVSVGEGEEEQSPREELPPDLKAELMPRHVAIIMDGNSRWAKERGMDLSFGHASGANALKRVARAASKWGIEVLTVFAFSTENWRRPQVEVDFLMHMFETKLQTEMENIMRHKFRLQFVGDVSSLPLSLQRAIESAVESTRLNTGMIMNVCVSYSGRADLVQACQQLAAQVAEGTLNPADIDDAAIASKVFMSELGELQDPDLVIRTSGEQRISNFLLWQVAYSEFVFSETLWPDFGKEAFGAALVTYQRRNRRYGIRDT